MPHSQNGGVADQFLNPESMLTPGAAGALTMMIANALSLNFELPRAHTALLISALFGLLIVVADRGWLIRGIYWLLNSMIIFCVAIGANFVGVQGTQPKDGRSSSLLGSALAAEVQSSVERPELRFIIDTLKSEIAAQRQRVDELVKRKGELQRAAVLAETHPNPAMREVAKKFRDEVAHSDSEQKDAYARMQELQKALQQAENAASIAVTAEKLGIKEPKFFEPWSDLCALIKRTC